MKVKIITIELPPWVRRLATVGVVVGAVALGWGVARASVPNTFADGNVLTAQALNDNFRAVETPPGTIIAWAGDPTKLPPGYLLCDGAPLDRNNYPALFAAIGTTWGGPNGAQFNIPDLRGRFLRGVGGDATTECDKRTASNTGGVEGCKVGTVQGDVFTHHGHGIAKQGNGGSNKFALPSGVLSDATEGTSESGGSETRPKNAAVAYLIKF